MRVGSVAILLLGWAPAVWGYSVLSHEAIVDASWEQGIRPLLVARFPNASPGDLKEAHAYAYGGCIIQDMGYYPFGSHLFSDLTHYVRSGDFVINLLREAQTMDEYAFALGALGHYTADAEGHSIGVNRSVPIDFPKLRRRFGPVVTYEDNPSAHLRVEFGFDVIQVARGSYAPQNYHDFIGFQVAKPVLERAFRDTYGLEMKDLFHDLDLALGVYRRTVSDNIPEMTRVAWAQKKGDLMKSGLTRRRFVYRLSYRNYHKEWNEKDQEPGIGAHVLAVLIEIFPKVGIFKTLSFQVPPPQTEALFHRSFEQTLDLYRKLLARQRAAPLQIADLNLDTGHPTQPGAYRMADNAYAKLAILLAKKDPAGVDPSVRAAVLAFFGDLQGRFATRQNPKEWRQTVAAVQNLQARSGAARMQQ